jgi:hypothetical protein
MAPDQRHQHINVGDLALKMSNLEPDHVEHCRVWAVGAGQELLRTPGRIGLEIAAKPVQTIETQWPGRLQARRLN